MTAAQKVKNTADGILIISLILIGTLQVKVTNFFKGKKDE